MSTLTCKYFWILDSRLPKDHIEGYLEALKGKDINKSKLLQYVLLLQAGIPIVPKVYITPRIKKYVSDGKLPKDFFEEFSEVISYLETSLGREFGGKENPLLLTVHNDFCGTIRNTGITEENVWAMSQYYGNEQTFNHYINFLESYSNLVLNCPFIDFKRTFDIKVDRETGAAKGLDELPVDKFVKYVESYKSQVSNSTKRAFPDGSEKHLLASLLYIAKSCRVGGGDEVYIRVQTPVAQFRQAMSGMAFTRDPYTGDKSLYGKYIPGAENTKYEVESRKDSVNTLSCRFPAVHTELKRHLPKIESIFKRVMEVEFVTDEDGKIVYTNFHKGDTLARATISSAISFNMEGKLSDIETIKRIKAEDLEMLLHPTLDEESRENLEDLESIGMTAAPGTVCGYVFFKMAEAIDYYEKSCSEDNPKNVILIADELLVSDAPGLGIISGLVTRSSGMASHAAVMARSNGIPCIIGYQGLKVCHRTNSISVNGKKVESGTLMTLEAATKGRLYLGEGKVQQLSMSEGILKEVSVLVTRTLKSHVAPIDVMVNINNHKDAQCGLDFGAAGVGLCRTENMLTAEESIRAIRKIIFSEDVEKCTDDFQKLEEYQFEEFKNIFRVMDDKDVKIRLMDMPLDELVPETDEECRQVGSDIGGVSAEDVHAISEKFKETNPMLGLRACRFGIITPQVYDMQIRAVVRAAYAVQKEGVKPKPGIMFPLVLDKNELELMRNRVISIEEEIRISLAISFDEKIYIKIGTMLELPAAALSADRLASISEFFAFGTNDLTQTTLGISRNDCENYLPYYIENNIFDDDPFNKLHDNVSELIDIAVIRGRRVRKSASFGVCGEQAGNIETLRFCLDRGINYVSCSAFRILPVRLSLAHIVLENQEIKK